MAVQKRPWSAEDVATAKRMRSQHKPYAEIGEALGRDGHSVRLRLNYERRPDLSVDLEKTHENGAYSRRQLAKQHDAFAGAMQRAMKGGQS